MIPLPKGERQSLTALRAEEAQLLANNQEEIR